MPERTQGHRDAHRIDLGVGHPDESLLPLEELRRSAAARLGEGDASLLQYGLEAGDPGVREELARFLARRDGAAPVPDPGTLLLTAGASQALDLLCTLLLRPGDAVVVEEPSYFLALRLFADHGLRVVAAPGDGAGPDPEALAALLAREKPRMLYLVPAFANPTGQTLAPERRARLAGLCREHDVWLVADEVYRLLAHDAPPPRTLARPEGEPHVVALGSFSKILAPGLRLGWIHGPTELIGRLEGSGLLQSGGGLNPFTAALVGRALRDRLVDDHLDRALAAYRERSRALHRALAEALPESTPTTPPDGGYFLWTRLPGVDAGDLLPAAQARGVGYQPGSRFSPSGGQRDRVRLSFSYYEPGALREGALRLAHVYRDALARGEGPAPSGVDPPRPS